MKVSFDYDGTLDRKEVQQYAKSLIGKAEVWIVSSRMQKNDANPRENLDLYYTARKLGIPKAHIMLINMRDKYEFFQQFPNFLWHLDDNWEEARMVTEHTATKGIRYGSSLQWMEECEGILELANTLLKKK